MRGTLEDCSAFSRKILGRPLRAYQAGIADAIARASLSASGITFTVMMARQMGKNELSAHIEAYLLNLYRRRGGIVIKAAPSLRPQAMISRQRLIDVLGNPTNRRMMKRTRDGVELGRASCRFLSGAPESNVVGGTADLLLELDEVQDLTAEKIQKDFRPMASTANATIVMYGTAWDSSNPLERQKQTNRELQARDGIQRHFEYGWTTLGDVLPTYKAFVEAEVARLGREHPIIKTQYFLEVVEDIGKLISAAARALIFSGKHARLEAGEEGDTYVAGVDVAGQDQMIAAGMLEHGDPVAGGRDSTVVTIGRVLRNVEGEPDLEIVQQYAWTGADHPTQHHALRRLLAEVFPCVRIVVDSTGLGAGIASWLASALGEERVEPLIFTAPKKSALGFGLLAMAGTGRCRLYGRDDSADWRSLAHEIDHARYELVASEQMRWHVPQSAGHDDYLVSLALCCMAAGNAMPPPESAVVKARSMGDYGW